jgi:hypothetical protein
MDESPDIKGTLYVDSRAASIEAVHHAVLGR